VIGIFKFRNNKYRHLGTAYCLMLAAIFAPLVFTFFNLQSREYHRVAATPLSLLIIACVAFIVASAMSWWDYDDVLSEENFDNLEQELAREKVQRAQKERDQATKNEPDNEVTLAIEDKEWPKLGDEGICNPPA